jgi:hypothetical protein
MTQQAELDIPSDDKTIYSSATYPQTHRFWEDIELSAEIGKVVFFRLVTHGPSVSVGAQYIQDIVPSHIILDRLEEDAIGLPGDIVVVCSAHQTPQWPSPEVEPEELPDVFSPNYHRTVLFSKSVRIQPGKMRRWKPHIVIDPDTISEDEDE